jgi:hypothetical protein
VPTGARHRHRSCLHFTVTLHGTRIAADYPEQNVSPGTDSADRYRLDRDGLHM